MPDSPAAPFDLASLPALPEHDAVDAARFEADIVASGEPAVLRGVVRDWPAVAHARRGDADIAAYLARFDTGTLVDAVLVPPEEDGRIFYDATLAGFNFLRRKLPVSQVLEQALRYATFDRAPAVAVQSAPLPACLPGFAPAHPMPLVPAGTAPCLWFGTAIVTPAHFDESHNVACCVAGRRRFTVLPTEAIADLYVGPLDHAPTGTPLSLVDFRRPDLARFPRFPRALARARSAVLEPGDAIYLPPLWWHHVESLARFNVLVNYWWPRTAPGWAPPPSALDALLHAVASLRGLPPAQRAAWRTVFEHYVFDAARDADGHVPIAQRGVLGPMEAEAQQALRAFLAARLARR